MRTLIFALLLTAPFLAEATFSANGVKLGASEKDVKRAFPSAYCKPLEWNTPAADRRCDDAKASFGGVEARITIYLLKDAVQAIDVRFDTRELARVTAAAKKLYGAPASETRDAFASKGGKET